MRRVRNGGALISALFITALAAVMATALALQGRLLLSEGELVLHADQVYLDMQGVQLAAKNSAFSYAAQFVNNQNTAPQQVRPLKRELPSVEVDGMKLATTIDSETGKFNLNDLIYPGNQPRFVVLLRAVLPSVHQALSIAIAQSITAWMTTGSDDPYYFHLKPPYRSSENEFTDASELKLIKGVTPQIYTALEPYITALPVVKPSALQQPAQSNPSVSPATQPPVAVTHADVNALLAPVMLTIAPAVNIGQALAMVACRKNSGAFPTVQAFITTCGQQAGVTSLSNVTTKADYFLVNVIGTYKDRRFILRSLLHTKLIKNNKLNKLTVDVVWQEFA